MGFMHEKAGRDKVRSLTEPPGPRYRQSVPGTRAVNLGCLRLFGATARLRLTMFSRVSFPP